MTAGSNWLQAFPIRPASEAVEAVCESWRTLARVQLKGFHPGRREAELTRVLKAHVERVTAPERGLLGMWATEAVINEIDLETAELREERRTDIVYGWNDSTNSIQLVFEFKKLNTKSRSRSTYLGEEGLGRFVTGMYSRNQAVAVMVGVLTEPVEEVLPPLLKSVSRKKMVAKLGICIQPSGKMYDQPSLLFANASFDTEHNRPPELAPSHGTIRVAHLFLVFDYRSDQGDNSRTS